MGGFSLKFSPVRQSFDGVSFDAVPGNEREGYSEALVGVNEESRGIGVHAIPIEKQVINYEPNGLLNIIDKQENFTHIL